MIYTLTLNPALDYVMEPSSLIRGEVNRSESEKFIAAGKGINVSNALDSLEVENIPIALVGSGFAGDEYMRLRKSCTNGVFIRVEDCDTRVNVKINSGGMITEVNGSFTINKKEVDEVFNALSAVSDNDTVIISGSLPDGCDTDLYARIITFLNEKKVTVIADTSSEPMREILKQSEPLFLIKPNRHELGEIFCVEIESYDDAVTYAKKTGCRNVLVSMGAMGAVLVTQNDVYIHEAPDVTPLYTVGAGDVLLAGFVAEYIRNNNFETALSAGVKTAGAYVATSIIQPRIGTTV